MIDNLNVVIGTRIKTLRTEMSMTREKLAEKADISTQFLADIESGNKGISALTLYKLSVALSVSSDFILFGNKNNQADITDIFNSIPDSQKENAKKMLVLFSEVTNS